ncbi:uncharacterized protein METZ01_LOCUS502354, partial [marine metagenome]|tara:strand:+ start:27 stop:572 length:546 start_codon:yes stop_codon:yes gene_type:complete
VNINIINLFEETEESSSGLELLLPATSELVAGIFAFSIVFFFVWKWALPILSETLDQRANAIEGQISEAKNTKWEADKTKQKYDNLVSNADDQVKKILDEGKATAEKLKEGILDEARKEASDIVSKARSDSEAEKERISSEIKSEVADLSLAISEKVVSSMSKKDQKKLINEFIKDMESSD